MAMILSGLGQATLFGAAATEVVTAEATSQVTPSAVPSAEASPAPSPAASATATTKAKDEASGPDGDDKPKFKHKSPGVAFGLALFPGALVHGTGHMYAGSWLKGTGLLAVEGASIAMGYTSVINAINEFDRIQKIEKSNPGAAVSADYGPLMAQVGVALVCTTAFLWSWIDDMAGSATAANQYNKIHSQSDTTLQLRPEGGIQLAWRANF